MTTIYRVQLVNTHIFLNYREEEIDKFGVDKEGYFSVPVSNRQIISKMRAKGVNEDMIKSIIDKKKKTNEDFYMRVDDPIFTFL